MDQKEKTQILGSLLESMKLLDKEDTRLTNLGIHLQSISTIEERLWSNIKLVLGMPAKEVLGVFISDYWFDIAMDFVDGRCSKKVAVTRLLGWEKDFEE